MTIPTDATTEPSNYFTGQRLGYRTDEEIESLPTNAIAVRPRKKAYRRLFLLFVAVFCAIFLDRILPINFDDGLQTLDVFVITMGILGVVLYFPLLYFAWRCLQEEHKLMMDIAALEVERQEKFFPVQEEVLQRSVRLSVLRGLPIVMVLILFWESRLDRWGWFDWALLSSFVFVYAADFVCLEWYRREATKSCVKQSSSLITPPWPRGHPTSDSSSAPSHSPLIDAQIA